MKMPRRKYDARIRLCADNEAAFIDALQSIITRLKKDNPQENYKSVNGNLSFGSTIELLIDDQQTSANYYAQLNKFLEGKKDAEEK